VFFLPPYSPDLSPIELCWSKIKGILCSERATTDSQLDIAITKAIDEISEENAINWFNHCGLYSEAIF
jgi:transposase